MNRDFVDMLSALCEAEAEFLVVGAHALAAHGFPRATGDLDIWIRPHPDNAVKVMRALESFGAPLLDLTSQDLQTPGVAFQIGLPPCRIDILTAIAGVEFEDAIPNRLLVQIGDLVIPCLGRQDLIANKRASGRPKDLLDADLLESDQE